jgi:translin
VDLDELAEGFRVRFDARMQARERALAAARRGVRSCANAIRALHRGERDVAHTLMDEARASIADGLDAVRDHPEIRFAGYLQDAQKEYAEARITEALVIGADAIPGVNAIPGADELGVEDAPYLNGMAEAIGEGRRFALDLLRQGQVNRAEAVLASMEELYAVLVSIDYPDAITGNLRRTTDVARSLIEKTRGDVTTAIGQRDLREALDRHGRTVLGEG